MAKPQKDPADKAAQLARPNAAHTNAAARVALVAVLAVVTAAGCSGPLTSGPPESSSPSFPPGRPDAPDPKLAPYVVDGHGRNGLDDNGRVRYSVTCVPRREFDADDVDPYHSLEVPVTEQQAIELDFGAPCPTPQSQLDERS